ncbi:unnamed protein product [Paramecium octaurelia]|uniref:RING-type domain-containing protein n=1 Tax=Paramecium octaurelia TaxID=43137 RepID=A0A8S1XX97_PAROT|nr:unnamed protein product [Paramecium octaurelia]
MNTSFEQKLRSKSAYQDQNPYVPNPKIKIIEQQQNLNQTSTSSGQRPVIGNYCQKLSLQQQNLKNPKAQLKLGDFGRLSPSLFQQQNIVKDNQDRYQNKSVQYNPQQFQQLFEKVYEPSHKQNFPTRTREENNQQRFSIRSISEYKAPIQNDQNIILPHQNQNSKLQQQIPSQQFTYFVQPNNTKKQASQINQQQCSNPDQCLQINNNSQMNQYPQMNKESQVLRNSQILQNSQMNKDSQLNQEQEQEINIFESAVQIMQISCFKCQQSIKGTQFFLNCQHVFHISCLQELIIMQIDGFLQHQQLSCICKQKIPRIPNIDASFYKNCKEKLLLKQLEFIFNKYKEKLQTCRGCNFFWVCNSTQKNHYPIKYCMCKEK